MPALTKLQLERAEARIQSAKAKYIEARMAAAGLGERPEIPEYSQAEMLAMIENGTAKLKQPVGNRFGEFVDGFDYPDTPEMAQARAADALYIKTEDVIVADANAIADRLMDQIVFDKDGMAALERIAEAFKV